MIGRRTPASNPNAPFARGGRTDASIRLSAFGAKEKPRQSGAKSYGEPEGGHAHNHSVPHRL
jgi:hypothetical protein